MGIDTHGLHLLRYASRKFGPLGRTVTLGRQAVHLGPKAMQQLLGATVGGVFCEPLLTSRFGATVVDSIDNSPYESATVVADMNCSIPADLTGAYDTVLDFGTLEHIFDVAQAMSNIVDLCKLGGRILHMLPANGFCGHGFYQFSPELFFSYYSPRNGFFDTAIYFADLLDLNHWYQVALPEPGERINVQSSHEIYIAVITQRVEIRKISVQQSDYVHAWSEHQVNHQTTSPFGPLSGLREAALRNSVFARCIRVLDEIRSRNVHVPLRKHPLLTCVPAG